MPFWTGWLLSQILLGSLPFSALTRKREAEKVHWTNQAKRAFQELKRTLTPYPVLCNPNFERPLLVQTDALDTGLGAMLPQEFDGE